MKHTNPENRRVLVIAAHPDDEVLGCGGTIAALARSGATVKIAFLADGVSSRGSHEKPDAQTLKKRQSAAYNATKILGAEIVEFGKFPDNRMDFVPLLEIVKSVEALIEGFRPDTILTHFGGDLNVDHRQCYEAVLTACRPIAGHPVETILCFEVPSSTEWRSVPGNSSIFAPNWFFNISKTLELKIRALQCYEDEMRPWPHSRSLKAVEHLAFWRGASIGKDAAEAFMLVRTIS